MEQIKIAKGITLDKLGELFMIARKRYKAIPLLFGWKLVNEETDEKYRSRMYRKLCDWRSK